MFANATSSTQTVKNMREVLSQLKETLVEEEENSESFDEEEQVKEFENIADLGNNFMESYFKGVNPFDFIDESQNIDKQYVESVLREIFIEDKMTLSVVANK